MSGFDPYEDGIAIELTLSRPASEGDERAARDLLAEWVAPYEEEDRQRYRNCGLVGGAGDRVLVLWADRVEDPQARLRADLIHHAALVRMPVTTARITDAEGAQKQDLTARLGASAATLRPSWGRRVTHLLALAALLALVSLCAWGRWRIFTPRVARDLPRAADDVRFESIDRFPDSDFYLQARLDESSCRDHVLGHFPSFERMRPRRFVGWGARPDWFAGESEAGESTWRDDGTGNRTLVQCASGHLFFRAYTY